MTVRKVEIERLSVTSSKSFEAVVAALEAAVGHPDMVEFGKAIKGAQTFAELESAVNKGLGRTGLMMFMALDHAAILRKRDRAGYTENHALCDRQSAHHEGNGKACTRRSILRSGHHSGG